MKHFEAAAGVVVTASHNPPEYNGFKVYWGGNGAQIIPPHDSGIAAQIDIATQSDIELLELELAKQQGLLLWLSESFYDTYRQAVNNSKLLSNHTQPEGDQPFLYCDAWCRCQYGGSAVGRCWFYQGL